MSVLKSDYWGTFKTTWNLAFPSSEWRWLSVALITGRLPADLAKSQGTEIPLDGDLSRSSLYLSSLIPSFDFLLSWAGSQATFTHGYIRLDGSAHFQSLLRPSISRLIVLIDLILLFFLISCSIFCSIRS